MKYNSFYPENGRCRMQYYFPIRYTVDMSVDEQIDIDADWKLCLELIEKYELEIFAQSVCLQLFDHADIDAVVGADRLALISECQPTIGQAIALAQDTDRNVAEVPARPQRP